jgi:hypothetical protein
MTVIQREFYRSARGPAPTDEDIWSLIFDTASARLAVRHEWTSTGHSGVDEYEISEFLAQEGAERTAFLGILFGKVSALA